jgi:RNA recognition motif-containing protein
MITRKRVEATFLFFEKKKTLLFVCLVNAETDSSNVGKEDGNIACAASDTNDDIGSQADRRSDICGTDFENNEEARKSSQECNDGEKKEIQEHAGQFFVVYFLFNKSKIFFFKAGCTLYVRNLPPHIRTENMKEHFTQFGEVVDCRIIMNPVTK